MRLYKNNCIFTLYILNILNTYILLYYTGKSINRCDKVQSCKNNSKSVYPKQAII